MYSDVVAIRWPQCGQLNLYSIVLELVSICCFSRSSGTFTCLEGIDRRSRSAIEQSFLAALLEKLIREHANEDDNAHDGEVERARNSEQIDEVLQDLRSAVPMTIPMMEPSLPRRLHPPSTAT